MQVPLSCKPWPQEPARDLLPGQLRCLEEIRNAGYLPFTASGSMIGAVSETSCVYIIYRGKSIYWEVDFVRYNESVKSLFTCDLIAATNSILLWLEGNDLSIALESLKSFIVDRPGLKPNNNH